MRRSSLPVLAAIAAIWIGTGLSEVAGQKTASSIVGSWGRGPTIDYIFTADGRCIRYPGDLSERKGTYKFDRSYLTITFVVKVKLGKMEEGLPITLKYDVKSLARDTLVIEDTTLQHVHTYRRTGSAPKDKRRGGASAGPVVSGSDHRTALPGAKAPSMNRRMSSLVENFSKTAH